LIVDDEEHIYDVMQRILKRLGFRTLTATAPEAALQ
jgi:CheY-like chemotaxis protein